MEEFGNYFLMKRVVKMAAHHFSLRKPYVTFQTQAMVQQIPLNKICCSPFFALEPQNKETHPSWCCLLPVEAKWSMCSHTSILWWETLRSLSLMGHVLGGRGKATVTLEADQAMPEGVMQKTGWAKEASGVGCRAAKRCHTSRDQMHLGEAKPWTCQPCLPWVLVCA